MQVTWARNAKLGRFTNFVNLLDMCAVAVPSGLYQRPQIGGGLLGDLTLSGTVALLRVCWVPQLQIKGKKQKGDFLLDYFSI